MKRLVPWALFAAILAIALPGKYYEYRVQVPDGGYAEDSLLGVAFLLFPLIGALVLSRDWSNGIGWVLMAVGVFVALLVWGMGYRIYSQEVLGEQNTLTVVAAWFESWVWFPLIMSIPTLLFLLFPDGKVPSPRWRWVARAALLLIALFVMPAMFQERLAGGIDNPIGIEGLENPEETMGFVFVGFLVVMVLCTGSLFVRYRRAGAEQRQQLKWFATAAVIMTLGIMGGELLSLPGAVFPLVLMGIPVSIGVAVLKYRLYDIDVVINRTLVYGALTAILIGSYLGLVFVLQALLSGITEQSDLAVAASTLAAAAMFRPLRSRVQGFIDRRFYRRKYNAQLTLEIFSTRLREDVDLDHLAHDLARAVRDTMQPAHVSVWLRPQERA